MTREEAIKVLRKTIDNSVEMTIREWEEFDKQFFEAIDMAIEALHREEAEEKGYCHRINYIPKPCENANCDCVAVVRCKDCDNFDYDFNYCNFLEAGVEGEDFFCAYGERREP